MPTRLGQNFLNDPAVLEKIIEVSKPEEAGFVLEVGPGQGVLTKQLAKRARKVLAIELDDTLIPALRKKFKDAGNIEIIHADILKMNLPALVESQKSKVKSYKVIANIPYYITSPIIRLFLEQEIQPQEMILMVQKEVAERIVAKAGEMSILAAAVQYYAEAETLFSVGKESFSPSPKVDSAVIRIKPVKKFEKERDKEFFRVVRAGFSAKRKTLLNNMTNGLQLNKSLVAGKLAALGLKGNARAQELSIEDWKKLSRFLRDSEK